MNKNDLRFIKTEDLIIFTYEEMLRSNITRINVTQLCKAARINTSTFYTHYMDIEELHTSLCRKRLTELLDNEPALNLLYEDPGRCIQSLSDLITDHRSVLDPLFAERTDLIIDIVEEKLLAIYANEKAPGVSETKVRFCVGGAMHILSGKNGKERTTEVIELIEDVMK